MTLLKHVVNAEHRQRSEDGNGDREQDDVFRIVDRAANQKRGDGNTQRQDNKTRREHQLKNLHENLAGEAGHHPATDIDAFHDAGPWRVTNSSDSWKLYINPGHSSTSRPSGLSGCLT